MDFKKIAAATAAVGGLTSMLLAAGLPAASASASVTIADQLAGSDPRDATNCGERTCTTYYNRASTQAWAENLPPILETTDLLTDVGCSAIMYGFQNVAGIAGGIACQNVFGAQLLHEVALQAQLADAANGCLEVEKFEGTAIRVGYTTHSEWCGGN